MGNPGGGVSGVGGASPCNQSNAGSCAGASSGGSGGSTPSSDTGYCAQLRKQWQSPDELPSLDLDCEDFSLVPAGDVPCSGAGNAQAQIRTVRVAQTDLLEPTSDAYVKNDVGSPITYDPPLPKFRLISDRPALVFVDVVGTGASPEVKVVARNGSRTLGSYCLKGPAELHAAVPKTPSLATSFSVTLPAAWVQTGLEFDVTAGGSTKAVPATSLPVAGGIRNMVFNMSIDFYGVKPLHFFDRHTSRVAGMLPVQSYVIARVPVPVDAAPYFYTDDQHMTPTIATDHAGDEPGAALDLSSVLTRASGMSALEFSGNEAVTYGSIELTGYAGGVTVFGNSAGGSNELNIVHHELGHAYGLPHDDDSYRDHNFDRADYTVGPVWGYHQAAGRLYSPFGSGLPIRFLQDPMGGGGENMFAPINVQRILRSFQDRTFYDLDRQASVKWDAAKGAFAVDPEPNDNFYDRPVSRNARIYTVFGKLSNKYPEVNVIYPPLHYRGFLTKIIDPTSDTDLGWLRGHPGVLCGNGCNYAIRATFADNSTHSYLLKQSDSDNSYWAVNIPDNGKLTKLELFNRPLNDRADGTVATDTGATFFDSAKVLASRTF